MVLKVKGFIKDIFLLQNKSNSGRATYFNLLLFMSSSKKKKMEGSFHLTVHFGIHPVMLDSFNQRACCAIVKLSLYLVISAL